MLLALGVTMLSLVYVCACACGASEECEGLLGTLELHVKGLRKSREAILNS